MLPERLTRVHVRKMHLDKWDMCRGQGVAKRHTGVGKGRRVQQDKRYPVFHRLLHPPNQLVLGVALEETDTVSGGLSLLGKALIDDLKRGRAVVLWLSCAEQIQVGTV